MRADGVAMDSEGIEPSSLRDKLKSTGAKLVFCTAAVQNPTTATMSMSRRREIISICKKAGALIVEDDIYGVVSGEELPALAAIDGDQVIHISSLSKCLKAATEMRKGDRSAPPSLTVHITNSEDVSLRTRADLPGRRR